MFQAESLPEAEGTPACPGQLLYSQLGLPLPCSFKWVKTGRACHADLHAWMLPEGLGV